MADSKISALTAATTPFAGTEVLPIVQSSTTKKVDIDDLVQNGTGGVYALPLIKNQGTSTTLAAAMEAFSAAMSKDGKRVSPATPEQGVIELEAGMWTLERTFDIELTGAVSRFGLTIRGQGDAPTIIYANATSSAANFKGGDNIWRMFHLNADASGKFERFQLENLELLCYFTQNGDGTTRLSDACRIIDTDYMVRMQMRNVRTYARSFTAMSTNQIGLYVKRAYYGNINGFKFTSLSTSNYGVALNNATTGVGYGGVGIVIDECNSLQVQELESAGVNVGAWFTNDSGAVINGYHMEQLNRGFHFENGANSCKALNGYMEFHFTDSQQKLLTRDQMAVATFSATTYDNEVTVANGASLPRLPSFVDRSKNQSNRVSINGQLLANAYSARPLSSAPTLSGVTAVSSTDKPARFQNQSAIAVTWPGTYGQAAYWTYTIDPRAGNLNVLTSVKRVSGDGMMVPLVTSAGVAGTNTIAGGHLLDAPARFGSAAIGSTITIDSTGNTYSASGGGEITLTFKRPHLLQPGMRIQTSGAVGGIAGGTNLYCRSVTSETVATFTTIGGLADPTPITSGTLAMVSDMYDWLGQPDATRDWLDLDRKVKVSYNVIGLALDGSNIPVITLDTTCANAGIVNGSKLMVWGFNDSRLDGVAYTALTADISGSTITLNALGAMASLDTTTAADNGLDSITPVYGKIGFTEVYVALIGKTTGGTSCVWRVTKPVVVSGGERASSMPMLEGELTPEVYAWSSKPAATMVAAGTKIKVSDIGYSEWVSNGTEWRPATGVGCMLQTGVPLILPGSASIGNNGALSGLAALPTTFAQCFMYFPANAISAGSAAGMYYVVMSSTTAGTIYNNTYTSGDPAASVPSSPTAFSTTGPGAYTQTTGSPITLLSYSLPANAMGLNSACEISGMWTTQANNANTKTITTSFGGSSLGSTTGLTSALSHSTRAWLANRNSQSLQTEHPGISSPYSASATAQSYLTVNTANAVTIAMTGQLATATDSIMLTSARVIVYS